MPRHSSNAFTIHAEGGPQTSARVAAPSAFLALSNYRRMRRARFGVVLITNARGYVTDEAALLRGVRVKNCGGAMEPQSFAHEPDCQALSER